MKKLLIQISEGLLVIGLLLGLLSLRDPNVPRIPLIIGITVNLCLQAAMIKALRKQKSIEQLSPAERNEANQGQRALLKPLFIASSFLSVVLMVDVGLFISHTYSARVFAIIALVAMVLSFAFLTHRFSQLKKSQARPIE